jgi:hypothetical protein
MHAAARIAILAFPLAVAVPASGGDIYKCVEADSTTYQATPCLRTQAEVKLVAGAAQPRAEPYAVALRPAPQPASEAARRAGPWKNRTVVLGMSDDEILNMPGWGRPSRIVRSRAPREWREVWTYGETVTGQRELHFANARLRDIVDLPGPQVARLTLQ